MTKWLKPLGWHGALAFSLLEGEKIFYPFETYTRILTFYKKRNPDYCVRIPLREFS